MTLIVVFIPLAIRGAEPPLEVVTATYFGSAEDDLQSVAAAPDGTIYVAGSALASI